MYSTNLKDSKYPIICLAVMDRVCIVDFIVDTGAMYTCCNHISLKSDIRESDFSDSEIKFIGGFVKGLPVKFYKCRLKQFTIGNIDMGEQDIWITFDERVTDTVLGMDILRQIIFIANPYNERIYFCKDADDYNDNFDLEAV
ncbi:MAG: retropepsin-like domain-containing protein [Roseburia sp.]|nr:retropepsin-like domain-containing protein [Roseburia sp.]